MSACQKYYPGRISEQMPEYRMRYWDKGIANGPWADVQKATVAP